MDKDLILAKLQENPAISKVALAKYFNVTTYSINKFLKDNNINIMSASERLAIRNKLLCTKPPVYISNNANQIILGSLLGDGSVIRKPTNGIFTFRHSLVQKDYALYKYNLLKQENLDVKYTERAKSYKQGKINNRYIKDNGFCEVHSKVNQAFNKYREEWYTPTKEVPDSVYELNTLGLAIWYMDDGSIHYPTGIYFSTNGFNHSSILKLKDMMLKNFNLHVNIHKNKDKEILYLVQADVNKFISLIKDFVCPSMNYKIIGHDK